jgi:hypothetical protein
LLVYQGLQNMAHIISGLVQNVGGGIGLVSEAYKAHKANKIQKQAESNSYQLEPSTDNTIMTHNTTEEAWELNEAQDEITNSPEARETDEPTDPITLANAFISRLAPSPSPSSQRQKLPFPIIIPQRRPKDRSRGMIAAYPPILSTRSIDQPTFLDFLETFNKSTRATKWIAALNLASIGTIWLPTVTSILVSMAITAATTAAMEVQGRYKTNKFLDKVNKEFFMPKGLFCLVLTWNPETSDARTAINFEGLAAKVMENDRNPLVSLRKSNGKTYGEFQWPETASLIYPGLDDLAVTTDEGVQAKKSSLQKKRRFVEDYMDRRAQAKFVSFQLQPCYPPWMTRLMNVYQAMENPDSALAAGPKPSFSSRFADPSHVANSGSLIALISGGAVRLPERANMLDSRRGYGQGGRMVLGRDFGGTTVRERAQRDAESGIQRGLGGMRGGRGESIAGPLGLVQKVMKKVCFTMACRSDLPLIFTQDVLYLVIVDMPSDDELAAAQGIATELMAGQGRS